LRATRRSLSMKSRRLRIIRGRNAWDAEGNCSRILGPSRGQCQT
jgi:hypothetical protein